MLNDKVLYIDGRYRLNIEKDYNIQEIKHNLNSFKDLYTLDISLSSRNIISLAILGEMNKESIHLIKFLYSNS